MTILAGNRIKAADVTALGLTKLQAGSVTVTITSATFGTATVTFPTAFAVTPSVSVTAVSGAGSMIGATCRPRAPDPAPWLGSVIVAAGIVARIMQADAVEALLEKVLGGSLATPAPVEPPTLEGLGGTRQNFIDVGPMAGDALVKSLRDALRRRGERL